jgi:hypothetical protein
MQRRESEQITKGCLSSDCSLKLDCMKLESLVIVDQHATVNLLLGLVHTACQSLGIDLAKNKRRIFLYCIFEV